MSDDSLRFTDEAPARSPEQLLWRAVLARAIKDARGEMCEPYECADARCWLLHADHAEDRALKCDLAGVDVLGFNRGVRRDKASWQPIAEPLFTERQLERAWARNRREQKAA